MNLNLNNDDIPYSLIAIKKTDKDKIYTSIEFDSYFEAPLYSNTSIGCLTVFINDTPYFKVDILNSNDIIKKSVFYYFKDLIFNYCKYLV